jgi:hypothetical protein
MSSRCALSLRFQANTYFLVHLALVLLCSSHSLAQTACSKSELKGALIGQNVMTRVLISRKVSGVGAVPVVGIHARFRIASVKLVGDVLQIHLDTKFGDAET